MSAGSIVVELNLDGNKFDVGIKSADGSLRRFERSLDQTDKTVERATATKKTWARTLRDSVIVLGLARHAVRTLDMVILGLPRSIIRANAAIEQMTALMRGMSAETESFASMQEDAERSVEWLFNLSKRTPFEVNALTDSFVKFRSIGLDPTDGSMQALVDSVAKFGGGADILKRASIAIQQMAGKGVISMEELRQQLGEAVPDAIQLMSRGLNLRMREMVDLISLGKVEAQNALAAMFRQMAIENSGFAVEMSNTWDGIMNRLKTRLTLAAKEIGDAGFYDAIKKQLQFLVDDVMNRPEVSRALHDIGKAMAWGVEQAANGIGMIANYWNELKLLATAAIAAAVAIKALQVYKTASNTIQQRTINLNQVLLAQEERRNMILEKQTAIIGSRLMLQNGAYNRSIYETSKHTAQLRTDLIMLGNTARSVGGMMANVGRSIYAAFGGLPGILITAGTAIATFYMTTRREHEATMETLKRRPLQLLNDEELKLFERQLRRAELLQEQIKKKQAEAANAQWITFRNQANAEAKDLSRQLELIVASIGDIDEARAKLTRMAQERQRKAVEDEMLLLDEQVRRQTQTALSAYRAAITASTAEHGSTRTRERAKQEAARLEDELRSVYIQKFDEMQAELEERRNRLLRAGRRGALTNAQDAELRQLESRFDALIELRERYMSRFDEKGGLVILEGDDDRVQFSAFERFVIQRTRMLDQLKARIEDTNPYLAEFNSLLEAGVFGTVEPEAVKTALELMERLNNARKEWDQFKDQEKAFEDSLKAIDQQLVSINTRFLQRENDNPWMRDTVEAEKLKVRLNEVRRELEALNMIDGTKIESALSAIDRASRAADAGARATTASQMAQQAEAIRERLLPEMQQVEAQYRRLVEQAQAWFEANRNALSLEQIEMYREYMEALNAEFARNSRTPVQQLVDEWMDMNTQMQRFWANTMNSFVDTLTDAIMTGKMQFRDFFREIASMIVKIQMQKAVAGIVGSFLPTPGAAAASPSVAAFAKGGIMTKHGEVPLRAYANGGIARSPQLALFGEGSQPEAYVPLPDGRTIPVTMKGAGGAQMPAISINVLNQSGQPMDAEIGAGRFDGESYVLDVVLSNMNRPGSFRSGMKSAINK